MNITNPNNSILIIYYTSHSIFHYGFFSLPSFNCLWKAWMAVSTSDIVSATLSGRSTPNVSSILTITSTASKESSPSYSKVAFLLILSAFIFGS